MDAQSRTICRLWIADPADLRENRRHWYRADGSDSMLKTNLVVCGAVLAGGLFAGTPAQAQSSSLFGNRGVQNSSNQLSGGVGASNQQSSFGNTGTLSGFSGTSVGSQQGYASGLDAGSGLAGMANSGTFAGNRLSANAAQQAGGTGGAQGGAANRAGGAAGRNGSGLQSLNASRNAQRNRNNANRGGGASSGTTVRPMQRMAFDYSPKTGTQIAAAVGTQVSLANAGLVRGFAVEGGDNGVVTLKGEASTEADRRKAEVQARLEPGVRNVVNQITVAPPQP
jgi:osmotically-inducible protein OsmY